MSAEPGRFAYFDKITFTRLHVATSSIPPTHSLPLVLRQPHSLPSSAPSLSPSLSRFCLILDPATEKLVGALLISGRARQVSPHRVTVTVGGGGAIVWFHGSMERRASPLPMCSRQHPSSLEPPSSPTLPRIENFDPPIPGFGTWRNSALLQSLLFSFYLIYLFLSSSSSRFLRISTRLRGNFCWPSR